MNRAVILGLLFICLVVSATAQKTSDWTKYTSAEGRYSVLMPAEPKVSQQESASADGVKFPQFLAESPDGSDLFLVGYFDRLPNSTFSLDKGRDGMISSVKGATLISEDSISLGGSPGRQLRLSAPLGDVTYLVRARFYVIGERVYVLQFLYPKSEDGPSMDTKAVKFFDSFTVKDK